MQEIWTRDAPSFNGEFISFPPIHTYPKPLQKPHPPIFIGAGGIGEQDCAQALRTTVEIADGWMPAVHGGPQWLAAQLGKLKELCAQRGRDFSTLEISALISPSQGRRRSKRDRQLPRGRCPSADLPSPAPGAEQNGTLPGTRALQVHGVISKFPLLHSSVGEG